MDARKTDRPSQCETKKWSPPQQAKGRGPFLNALAGWSTTVMVGAGGNPYSGIATGMARYLMQRRNLVRLGVTWPTFIPAIHDVRKGSHTHKIRPQTQQMLLCGGAGGCRRVQLRNLHSIAPEIAGSIVKEGRSVSTQITHVKLAVKLYPPPPPRPSPPQGRWSPTTPWGTALPPYTHIYRHRNCSIKPKNSA